MAARQRRVSVNPCSEALQVPDGRARQAVVAALLWWHLRRHRSARRGSLEEGQPLLAPGAVALQVTLSAIGLQAVPPALTSAALPALHRCPDPPHPIPAATRPCPTPRALSRTSASYPVSPQAGPLLQRSGLAQWGRGRPGLAHDGPAVPGGAQPGEQPPQHTAERAGRAGVSAVRATATALVPDTAQDTHPRRGAACFAWVATACVRCPRS